MDWTKVRGSRPLLRFRKPAYVEIQRKTFAVPCPVFDCAAPIQMRDTSSKSQGGVVLWFQAATAQRMRERAIAHCSRQTNMKHRDARCFERGVYDVLMFLNRVWVFQLWIRYNLMLSLKILRRGLSYFGIFEKQDSSEVKPQQRETPTRLQWGEG